MLKHTHKKSPIMTIANNTLVNLPAPSNLSTMWNMGSLLGLCLMIQITTGITLAMSYSPSFSESFSLIFKNMETMTSTWLVRYMHANGASLFFIFLYIHVGRGIYYLSFNKKHTWNAGVTLLLLTMATAFLGYVLPNNQMSFWGASVITNLFSEVPYIGKQLVHLIWGAVTVSDPTLTRFFALHYMIPFMIMALAAVHITLLHDTGSSNPLGLPASSQKIMFLPIFVTKDMLGILIALTLFIMMNMYKPLMLGDDENFTNADPTTTPHHIQPEWYFLFAYAILRSIPNKLGGVIALIMAVTILYTMPSMNLAKKSSNLFYPLNKMMFWMLILTVILLTWIGMQPVEDPYTTIGQLLTLIYFSYFFLNPLTHLMMDKSKNN